MRPSSVNGVSRRAARPGIRTLTWGFNVSDDHAITSMRSADASVQDLSLVLSRSEAREI